MITVEQVEQLNNKVRKAVGLIEDLKEENRRLRIDQEQLQTKIDQMQAFIDESQRNASTLSDVNATLSKGVLGAIDQLSVLDGENAQAKADVVKPIEEQPSLTPLSLADEEYVLANDTEEAEENQNALFSRPKEEDNEAPSNKHMDIF